jgi:hypothetical protein
LGTAVQYQKNYDNWKMDTLSKENKSLVDENHGIRACGGTHIEMEQEIENLKRILKEKDRQAPNIEVKYKGRFSPDVLVLTDRENISLVDENHRIRADLGKDKRHKAGKET